MDTLELRELDSEEMVTVNGGVACGGWCLFAVGVGVASVTAIINDWDNFKRGLRGQPEK